MNEQPTDEKWLDEQLDVQKLRDDNFAIWNSNSIWMTLSIINGTLQCDLGFTMKVLPRHRKAAKEKLLRFIDWFENTPLDEIVRQRDKLSKEMSDGMNAMIEARGKLIAMTKGTKVQYKGKVCKVSGKPYISGQYLDDESKPQNWYVKLDGIGEIVMDDCKIVCSER